MNSNSLESELLTRRGFTIFLRLMAAVAVLCSHSWPLSGRSSDPIIGSSPLGEVAVSVFFVLSGYFVFNSSLKHNILEFILLRLARLFPALFAANFILAFVIGPAMSFHANDEVYWESSNSPLSFFLRNSTLLFGLQPRLANVFDDNPYVYVVNGSLWTLPTELKCYILCALLAVLVKLTNNIWPLYISFVGLSLLYILSTQGNILLDQIIPNSTLRLFVVFFSGALVARMKLSGVKINWTVKFFSVAFFCTVWMAPTLTPFLYWTLIPAIVLIPTRASQKFQFFNQRDFSYGFYLWAFPIQQLTIYFGFATTVLSFSVFSAFITLGVSVGSWYLVELPATRYVRNHLNSHK